MNIKLSTVMQCTLPFIINKIYHTEYLHILVYISTLSTNYQIRKMLKINKLACVYNFSHRNIPSLRAHEIREFLTEGICSRIWTPLSVIFTDFCLVFRRGKTVLSMAIHTQWEYFRANIYCTS